MVSNSAANPSIKRYFDIVPTVNVGLNSTMKFKYFDWEMAGFTEANLKLYKAPLPYNPANPMWVEQLQAVEDVANNWLTETTISSFSRWTAADFNAPLPIELLSFDALLISDKVKLDWSTATEVNNDYFSIEKSLDAQNWSVLGTVKGAGNSNQKLDYEYFDFHPVAGIQYYRLKQTDFDGTDKIFDPINVHCDENNQTGFDISAVNTDDAGNCIISFTCPAEEEKLIISLYDNMGQRIFSENKISAEGLNVVSFSYNNLAKSVYFITLTSPEKTISQKILLN